MTWCELWDRRLGDPVSFRRSLLTATLAEHFVLVLAALVAVFTLVSSLRHPEHPKSHGPHAKQELQNKVALLKAMVWHGRVATCKQTLPSAQPARLQCLRQEDIYLGIYHTARSIPRVSGE